MPRVAKTKVKICVKCNGEDTVAQFEKLLEGKNATLTKGCVGQGKCGTDKPFCKIGTEVHVTDTVEELAALIS